MDISDENVAQVSLLCPDTDEDIIRHDLSITNDITATINRILDNNVGRPDPDIQLNDDEDLPIILPQLKQRPKNTFISLDDDEKDSVEMSAGEESKNFKSRKTPYNKNDFLSDSSDIENDVEIIEPLSLRDRLLGKQFKSDSTTNRLIDTSNEQSDTGRIEEKFLDVNKCRTSDDVINIDKCLDVEINMNSVSYGVKPSVRTTECVETVNLCNREVSLTDTVKPTKRKRNPEEIEERKRQAQMKKEETGKKKLEREKAQQEKKKNVQIRKLEGERKKQMGAWNQSLEFMKIVLDPHIINDCGLGAAIFKAGEELKVPCVTEEQGFPFMISWKRTVTDWIDNGSQVEPVKKEVTEDEALTIIPVSDFVQMVDHGKQGHSEGKTTLRQYLKMVQQQHPGVCLTPVVIGLEKYFRELKTVQQRQHREAVLTSGQSSETTTKKKKNVYTVVSRIDVEEACTEAHLYTGCGVQMLDTPEEITDLVKTYTKAVAEKPAKKDRLNSVFSFHEDGSTGVKVDKSGYGLLKVWKQQLLQFKNISPDISEAIISEYPSPTLLIEAYSRCSSQEEGVKVLENIVVRRGAGVLETTRRIGKEMSRRFYLFFNNTDPTFTLK